MKTKFKWFTGIVVALYVLNIIFFYKLPFGSTVFRDVPSDHWALQDIEYMFDRGLMKGRDETVWNFYPTEPMTRAELVALMLKVKEVDTAKLAKPTQSPYADVSTEHWSSAVLAEAAKRNLIPFKDAQAGGTFQPDKPITRGELAQGVQQTLALKPNLKTVDLPDIKGTPYEDAIKTVVNEKYAKGNEDGEFKPAQSAKREEVAAMFATALSDIEAEKEKKDKKGGGK